MPSIGWELSWGFWFGILGSPPHGFCHRFLIVPHEMGGSVLRVSVPRPPGGSWPQKSYLLASILVTGLCRCGRGILMEGVPSYTVKRTEGTQDFAEAVFGK